jgi:hypothetical protein
MCRRAASKVENALLECSARCACVRARERPRENWRARKLGVRRAGRAERVSLSGPPPPRQQLPLTPVRPMMTPDGTVITRDGTALICSSVVVAGPRAPFFLFGPVAPNFLFQALRQRLFPATANKVALYIPEARDEKIFSLSIFVLALGSGASYDVMNEME